MSLPWSRRNHRQLSLQESREKSHSKQTLLICSVASCKKKMNKQLKWLAIDSHQALPSRPWDRRHRPATHHSKEGSIGIGIYPQPIQRIETQALRIKRCLGYVEFQGFLVSWHIKLRQATPATKTSNPLLDAKCVSQTKSDATCASRRPPQSPTAALAMSLLSHLSQTLRPTRLSLKSQTWTETIYRHLTTRKWQTVALILILASLAALLGTMGSLAHLKCPLTKNLLTRAWTRRICPPLQRSINQICQASDHPIWAKILPTVVHSHK